MLIVGAGAAGLSLAVLRPDARVVERSDRPGGLCRSHTVGGFTFDLGPHILGGIREAVAWVVESTGIRFVEGRTRNVGYHDGQWVAHPFADPQVGERYMHKMWKTDPVRLSAGGLGAQPGRKPGGVSTFLYPEHGGYQAITDAWAAQVGERLEVGVTVHERTHDMVWTAPLPDGRYNALGVATIGYLGAAPDLTAVYLPDGWTPFHRLSFPSAFSPHNAPPGTFTVQGEVSNPQAGDLIAELDATVRRLGLAAGPMVMWHQETVPYAYPVPVCAPADRGHGRTGGHRYLNLDGVVAESLARAVA